MIQQQKQSNPKLLFRQSPTRTVTVNVSVQTAFRWRGERRQWPFHSQTRLQMNMELIPKVTFRETTARVFAKTHFVSFFSIPIESPSFTTRHKCHNPGFCNVLCISLEVLVAPLLNFITNAKLLSVM